jgi:hypothetical protein
LIALALIPLLLERGHLRLELGELLARALEHPALHIEFFASDQVHALESAGQKAAKISFKIWTHDVQVTTGTRYCPREFLGQFADDFSFHDYSKIFQFWAPVQTPPSMYQESARQQRAMPGFHAPKQCMLRASGGAEIRATI